MSRLEGLFEARHAVKPRSRTSSFWTGSTTQHRSRSTIDKGLRVAPALRAGALLASHSTRCACHEVPGFPYCHTYRGWLDIEHPASSRMLKCIRCNATSTCERDDGSSPSLECCAAVSAVWQEVADRVLTSKEVCSTSQAQCQPSDLVITASNSSRRGWSQGASCWSCVRDLARL